VFEDVSRLCERVRRRAMTLTTFVLDALLFVVAWVHVLLAPYTKVEESFNLHAVHDVVMYGVGPSAISKVRDLSSWCAMDVLILAA
jgi:hypothetical protein